MKNIFSCLFFFFLLFIFVLPASANEITPSPSSLQSNYLLPYPGLLPDNPLYFLKSFRDNVMGFFIGKPIEKANFSLLQADKNIAASTLLLSKENEKVTLAGRTYGQGQDFFEEAIAQTVVAHEQGINCEDMKKTLESANRKYFQVLHDLIASAQTEDDKKMMQEEHSRADEFAKKIQAL
jgi:hypothetical protein